MAVLLCDRVLVWHAPFVPRTACRDDPDAPLRHATGLGPVARKRNVRNGARFGVANLSFITAQECAVNRLGKKSAQLRESIGCRHPVSWPALDRWKLDVLAKVARLADDVRRLTLALKMRSGLQFPQ